MRIRKRFHRLPTLPDLSAPPPVPSMGAAAGAVGVGAAGSRGREGEAVDAMKREQGGPGGGDGAGGRLVGEEKGLHRHGDIPAELFYGCTTTPASFLYLHHPPPEAPVAEGEGKGDPPAEEAPFIFKDMYSARTEMRKREEDEDRDGSGVIGAQKISKTNAHGGGAMAAAPESAWPFSVDVGIVVVPEDEDMAIRCDDDQEKGISLKRIEGRYRAAPEIISCGLEEEEEAEEEEDVMVDVEKDVRPRRRNVPRRRGGGGGGGADASIPPTDRSYASTVNVGGSRGAPSAATGAPGDGTNVVGGGNGKRRRSPLVLMEGSRCSRVNGRGWRCCQQTLVGYSLCEHHLGKGRLRSVARCSGRAKKKEEEAPPSPTSASPPQLFLGSHGYGGSGTKEEEEEDHHQQRRQQQQQHHHPVEKGTIRRRKIGTVKARSMSSLLRQADCPAAISDQEPSPSSPSNSMSIINPSRR